MQIDDIAFIQNDEDLITLPPLTDKQEECLVYLFSYFTEHRYYPTQREIAQQMHLKSNSAAIFIEPLIKKGYIEKEPGKNRNIHITKAGFLKLKLIEKKRKEKDKL
ncbi:MAG TPA: hypothetical protein PLM71_08360 [Syntrophorhabdaceae bacterium]|nr:hypothetical protein [Syntrophorhabdaceae bacterium]HPU30318.1 hypothetical protein [Syntrophorhabdaceae bacterium]